MKEDDMDEMMREAAENYEVDAGKAADWNAVYNAVHETESSVPVEEKKRRRGFIFWWLFLIPLGWIAHTEYNKLNSTIAKNAVTVTSKTNADAANTTAKPGNISDENKTSESITGNHHLVQPYQKSVARSQSNKKISGYNLQHYNATVQQQQSFSNQLQIQSQVETNNEALNNPATTSLSKNENNNLQAQVVINNQQSDLKQNVAPDVNNDKGLKPTVTASAKKSSSIKIKNNGHYFYAGLAAGIDLSFVKYQQIQPLGYNVGLLVGYKFNKISIESGLYLAKKNYYTNGEYFDKSKIPFFNNANLQSVDGYCRMYEIPVNVKYDFAARKRHTWFAAAGLSSYLMNKEFYNYTYERYGQQYNGSYPYYHTTQNWFSVLNMSAGYQLQTGVKTNLRIEPYFKSTLSGVGTGSLSISSAGINIGLIRRIP